MGVQLFITSVNKESLAGCLPDKGQLFHVEQGVFSTGIL
jgi:recombinational DNA repair ATPase RecF